MQNDLRERCRISTAHGCGLNIPHPLVQLYSMIIPSPHQMRPYGSYRHSAIRKHGVLGGGRGKVPQKSTSPDILYMLTPVLADELRFSLRITFGFILACSEMFFQSHISVEPVSVVKQLGRSYPFEDFLSRGLDHP